MHACLCDVDKFKTLLAMYYMVLFEIKNLDQLKELEYLAKSRTLEGCRLKLIEARLIHYDMPSLVKDFDNLIPEEKEACLSYAEKLINRFQEGCTSTEVSEDEGLDTKVCQCLLADELKQPLAMFHAVAFLEENFRKLRDVARFSSVKPTRGCRLNILEAYLSIFDPDYASEYFNSLTNTQKSHCFACAEDIINRLKEGCTQMTEKNTSCKCNCVPAQLSQQADIDPDTLAKDMYWANAGLDTQRFYFSQAEEFLKKYSVAERRDKGECLSNGEAK